MWSIQISLYHPLLRGIRWSSAVDSPLKWPVIRNFDETFVVSLNKLLKHFPRNWPFVRGIHRSPVNSPHNGQWRGALMFSLIWAWINGWASNRDAGDLRPHRAHYDVTDLNVMRDCKDATLRHYNGISIYKSKFKRPVTMRATTKDQLST